MNKIRVAINGFGRIGRTLARLIVNHPQIELIAINDLSDLNTMVHLFRYDSTHGILKDEIKVDSAGFVVGNQYVKYFRQSVITGLPWRELDIDIVIDCTGIFKKYDELTPHLDAGARRVLLSAPPEDDRIKTIVLGVNDDVFTADDLIISNASCTTNNAAPMIQLLDELCGIEGCYITTVHSYTGDQRLVDSPHKDLRRSRAAAKSIIPTSTGAAKALTRIFPHLALSMGGCGIRVPVPNCSLTDITCTVRRIPTADGVNEFFKRAAFNKMAHILEYTEDPIVSSDVLGNSHSCIFDSGLTSVIGNMVKVVGWYDNEFGYSSRLVDMICLMGKNDNA